MYKLTKISLQNWYLVNGKDIPVRDAIALIGPTGAGKSTIQDAIKLVIQGGSHRRLHLNPAANAGDNERSILDYCLGYIVPKKDGGKPLRTACESVIALTFTEELADGSKHDVTVGLAMSARLGDSREQILSRFIARGFAYSVEEFEDGEYMLSWDEAARRIKKQATAFIEHRSAERFVSDMLAVMRPRGKQPDPRHFHNAFANAIAFEPIGDPTQFVRSYILEPDPLDIDRVRESIFHWRSISEAARLVQEKIDRLASIRKSYDHWGKMVLSKVHHTLGKAASAGEHARLALAAAAHKLREDEAELRRQETIEKSQEANLEEVKNAYDSAKAVLAERGIEGKIRLIETEERAALLTIAPVEVDARSLRATLLTVANLDQDATKKYLPASYIPRVAAARAAVSVIDASTGCRWASSNQAEITRYLDEVRQVGALGDRLRPMIEDIQGELSELRRRRDTLDQNIKRMQSGGSPLGSHTVALMRLLEHAGIEATPLCDVVTVTDKQWQYAVEALLGPGREALIVDPSQVRRAHKIMFEQRKTHGLHRCRIVKTTDTRTTDMRVKADSIASVVASDNDHALAYVVVNIGGFEMVESEDALERSKRGIMKDGKTTSAMTYSVQREIDLILGRAAVEESATRARNDLANVKDAIAEKMTQAGFLDSMIKAAEAAQKITADIAGWARTYDEVERTLKDLEKRRQTVLSAEDSELAEEIAQLKEEIFRREEELVETRKALRLADGNARLSRASMDAAKANLRAAVKGKLRARLALSAELVGKLLEHVVPFEGQPITGGLGLYMGMRLRYARDPAGGLVAFKQLEKVHEDELVGIDQRISRAGDAARKAYDAYLRDYGIERPMKDTDEYLLDFHNLILQHNKLKDNELRHYLEQARFAEREMVFAIKEDLLTKLNAKFQKLDIQLRTLNRELKTRHITGQVYKFGRRVDPEFDRIRKLAIEIGNNPEKAQAIIEGRSDDLVLLAAMKELEEFLESTDGKGLDDYRRYFLFDLYMYPLDVETDDDVEIDEEERRKNGVISLSGRAAVSSGGESQAPFYIAIAASMALAYFPGGHTAGEPSGMGLVMFDEAFNRLDIPNTQALVNFYKQLGLQLLVAVPETSRPTLSEVMDTIVSVNKDVRNGVVHIAPEFPKERLRQELAKRNAVHVGVEGFRKIIEQEKAEADAAE